MALVVKNLPAKAGDARDLSSIPGSGRSPGVGNGNPFLYSCLGNPLDRRAWWTMATKSQARLSDQAQQHSQWLGLHAFLCLGCEFSHWSGNSDSISHAAQPKYISKYPIFIVT